MKYSISAILVLIVCVIFISSSANAGRDEFDLPELGESWIWDNPANDSSYDLSAEPGWLKITCAAGDHDIWNVRSGGPAVLIEAADEYTFETHYVTQVLDNCSIGLVFLNEDALGNANSPGPWCALFSQSGSRLFWQHAVGQEVSQANVANADDVYVKVEKSGDNWKFYYKENEGDAWELVIEDNYDIGGIHYAGLMVKNWSPGPEISASFDYVDTSLLLLAPVESAGKLAARWGDIKED